MAHEIGEHIYMTPGWSSVGKVIKCKVVKRTPKQVKIDRGSSWGIYTLTGTGLAENGWQEQGGYLFGVTPERVAEVSIAKRQRDIESAQDKIERLQAEIENWSGPITIKED